MVHRDFVLDEALDNAADEQTQYIVMSEDIFEGSVSWLRAAYLISRCAVETVERMSYGTDGRPVQLPKSRPKSNDRQVRRTLARLRGILREARERGIAFVCCFHVDGDAGWYMEWSDDYDEFSATEMLLDRVSDAVN
jgi:hypothetical protein